MDVSLHIICNYFGMRRIYLEKYPLYIKIWPRDLQMNHKEIASVRLNTP